MNAARDKLHRLVRGYETGLYSGYEVVGLTIDILAAAPDCLDLLVDVPEWAQAQIWIFVKDLDEISQLYNCTTGSPEIAPPNLVSVRNWLKSEKGYV